MAGNYVKQLRLVSVSSYFVPPGSIIKLYDNTVISGNRAERDLYLYKVTSLHSNQNGNRFHLTSPSELYVAKQLKTTIKLNNNLLIKFTGQYPRQLNPTRFISTVYGSGM